MYDLSLLASLPNSILPLLPPAGTPPPRPRPLFNVGIHDIPYLSSFVGKTPNSDRDAAWIACSTDSVLTMKSNLFDVLVTLPPPHSQHAAEKTFPQISILPTPTAQHNTSQAIELRATQRDARRYLTLRRAIHHISREESRQSQDGEGYDDESDAASTFSSSPVVEPLSWTRLAYTSFIWWASAGEKRDGLTEEEEEERRLEQDSRLLASVENLPSPPSGSAGRRSIQPAEATREPPEIALVAYFRRLTTQIFVTLSDVVARQDSNNDPDDDVASDADSASYRDNPNEESDVLARRSTRDSVDDDNNHNGDDNDNDNAPLLPPQDNNNNNPDDDPVTVTTEDMTEMGLDVWSAADRIFVEQLVRTWWNRPAYIDSARIRCCGVSIL